MADVLITLRAEMASDSWGFVGVVLVGGHEAYRTLESFPTPAAARAGVEELVADLVGELLAAREWRMVRESTGRTPTREDFALSALHPRRLRDAPVPSSDPPR